MYKTLCGDISENQYHFLNRHIKLAINQLENLRHFLVVAQLVSPQATQ